MIVNRRKHFLMKDRQCCVLFFVAARYRHRVWFRLFFIISARLGEKYINIWTRGAIAAREKRSSKVSRRLAMAIIIAVIVAVWKMNLSSHFAVWKYDFCQANVSEARENVYHPTCICIWETLDEIYETHVFQCLWRWSLFPMLIISVRCHARSED